MWRTVVAAFARPSWIHRWRVCLRAVARHAAVDANICGRLSASMPTSSSLRAIKQRVSLASVGRSYPSSSCSIPSTASAPRGRRKSRSRSATCSYLCDADTLHAVAENAPVSTCQVVACCAAHRDEASLEQCAVPLACFALVYGAQHDRHGNELLCQKAALTVRRPLQHRLPHVHA